MSHSRLRTLAIILASVSASAVVSDAQARRGHRHHGYVHHHFAGFARPQGAATEAGHFIHDHFAHNNPSGGGGYGWYGPVFWPYAYDDVFEDVLWGYGLGSPFWDYGYDDIYGGVFLPFGSNDLVGHLPPEQSQGTALAPVGRRAENRQAGRSGLISKMCGDDSREIARWPIDRIEQGVSPTAEQRAALSEFADAAIRAAQTIKDACQSDVAFTPTGRLEAMQKRIEGMVQAVTMVGPPLGRFYNSLTDEQKARLNAANGQGNRNRGSTAGCNAAGSVARWPVDQIEKAVQPSPEQYSKLDALKKVMLATSDDLADSCPSSLPATPPARLKAISRRLETMLKAVKNVRPVLEGFYASLSDEQTAQFNAIRLERSARR
jgi:hypothetical protein